MTLTIEIAPELEDEIRKAAQREGLSLDKFVVKSVLSQLRKMAPTKLGLLPQRESELLQQINHSMNHIDWERYKLLLSMRDDETLSVDEHAELIGIGDELEIANAQRIELLVELASLRQTTLPAVMNELGITPFKHDD